MRRVDGRRNTVADFARFCDEVGRPLEPFQRKIASAYFGREHELLVLIPKGNAKSSLAALLALHHLLAVRNPYILLGAGSRDQARVVYELARDLSEHPSLDGLSCGGTWSSASPEAASASSPPTAASPTAPPPPSRSATSSGPTARESSTRPSARRS